MLPSSIKLAREAMNEPGLTAFSFDIFDTFLLRRATGPDGVYERAFQLAPIPPEYKGMVESYIQNRQLAEAMARQENIKNKQYGEATIDEIYSYFPFEVFGLTSAVRAQLAEAEFKAELELCLLNSEIYDLFQEARALGLKTGFLSDTYWSREQLIRLLTNVAPDLKYDFLYPSCEYHVNKASGLFKIFMEKEGVEASQDIHIGDNPLADITVPRMLGIKSVFYPQVCGPLDIVMRREKGIMQMIQSQRGALDKRLDAGLMVVRRLAAARRAQETDIAGLMGVGVLGPAMAGFQRHIEKRVAELRQPGRKVAVAFLSRDGYLPLKIWKHANVGEAHYAEINSRVVVLSCADDMETFRECFRLFSTIDSKGMRAFFKTDIAAVTRYLDEQPEGYASGENFCNELPNLIETSQIKSISKKIRKRLIEYLRRGIPEFFSCTDLVIIDVGYRGTIQHSLRKLLDREGFASKRLHGIYLGTVDHKFTCMKEGDSVSGFLDSSVLTPSAQSIFLRNVTVLEQCCSAPFGSVRDYDGAKVIHEEDSRPKEQLEFFRKVQDACVDFFDEYQKIKTEFGIDPLANSHIARSWAATLIFRFLFRPTTQEQILFGSQKHDVNLGTNSLVDLISMPYIQSLMDTMTFAQLCSINQPVGWLAGSLSALSPLAAHDYAMVGFGFLENEMLSDRSVGKIEAKLIVDGKGQSIPGTCMLTALGDVRVRIPVSQKHAGNVIAIPLEGILKHGVLRSLVVQHGESTHKALHNKMLKNIPTDSLRYLQAQHEGPYFCALGSDSYMVIDVPTTDQTMVIITMMIAPLPPKEASSTQPTLLAS